MAGNKISNKLYGQNCDCEFEYGRDFKCDCGWLERITIDEQESFNALRIVSKSGILHTIF